MASFVSASSSGPSQPRRCGLWGMAVPVVWRARWRARWRGEESGKHHANVTDAYCQALAGHWAPSRESRGGQPQSPPCPPSRTPRKLRHTPSAIEANSYSDTTNAADAVAKRPRQRLRQWLERYPAASTATSATSVPSTAPSTARSAAQCENHKISINNHNTQKTEPNKIKQNQTKNKTKQTK